MEGLHRPHDLFRDIQFPVNVPVSFFRDGVPADVEFLPIGHGQHHGNHLVGGEDLPDGGPGTGVPHLTEGVFNGDQEGLASTQRKI